MRWNMALNGCTECYDEERVFSSSKRCHWAAARTNGNEKSKNGGEEFQIQICMDVSIYFFWFLPLPVVFRGVSLLSDTASASQLFCPIYLSTSLSMFLYPSLLLLLPLPHTYAPTRGMPESLEVLIRLVGVCFTAQPVRPGCSQNPSNLFFASTKDFIMRGWSLAFLEEDFLQARGHLPIVVKTGMLQGYDDSKMWWCTQGI